MSTSPNIVMEHSISVLFVQVPGHGLHFTLYKNVYKIVPSLYLGDLCNGLCGRTGFDCQYSAAPETRHSSLGRLSPSWIL